MKQKSKTKYLILILIITFITGFACTFATAKEDNQSSTKLDFEATEGLTKWVWIPLSEPWGNAKIMHQIMFKNASLDGKIDGIDFTGYNELIIHVKMKVPTFEFITIGKITMYIEWNGLIGTFYGPVIAKGVAGVGPFDGKYALQGTGDFEGMKLFGIVWLIGGIINGLSGTILIPN
ncbi:MAG: hypothetical protein ACFFB8_06490 [Promethearchaeota archaeon]